MEMKILVVEDDFTSRILIHKLLAPYGDVHIAVDGKEAVAVVEKSLEDNAPYALICLDLMMPEAKLRLRCVEAISLMSRNTLSRQNGRFPP